jgi:hypothetical protein
MNFTPPMHASSPKFLKSLFLNPWSQITKDVANNARWPRIESIRMAGKLSLVKKGEIEPVVSQELI